VKAKDFLASVGDQLLALSPNGKFSLQGFEEDFDFNDLSIISMTIDCPIISKSLISSSLTSQT
jgi:hypothetical protein